MIRINKRIDRSLDYYDDTVERRYVDCLKETGNALVIDNLIVDVPAVVRRRFVCHTDLCIGAKPLDSLAGRSCCSSFAVRVAPKEIRRIETLLPQVRRRYPGIAETIDRLEGAWWHYDEEDYNKALKSAPNGGCIFLTPREDGMYKCALHAAAMDLGVDPNRVKPAACLLFPLFVVEVEDNLLLTCTSEETRHVIDDNGEYHHFDCLCPNAMAPRPLYVEMAGAIRALLGKKAYKKMVKEIEKRGL
ncbi:MAG: DUF3109 family protein [Candidatus Sumerlaeota bacterium]|nr:DUF3109 family protein [Candidatus Sumerlaeota bacterium]